MLGPFPIKYSQIMLFSDVAIIVLNEGPSPNLKFKESDRIFQTKSAKSVLFQGAESYRRPYG